MSFSLVSRLRALDWNTPEREVSLREDPQALLLRLFRDGGSIATHLADALDLPRDLLIGTGDHVRSRYQVDRIRHLLLFSDWRGMPGAIVAPGETTAILARAAQPRSKKVGRMLDLGCGAGTLALLLAPSSGFAVGTDIDPHAVDLSRRNALFNGIRNVEFRCGRSFEPVCGERFDLIVSQPPYVPLPAGVPEYRYVHGGPRGDELAREFISGMARHLSPGGQAWIFSDWPLQAGETVASRMPLAGLSADLFLSPPVTPESYAQAYGSDLLLHLQNLEITGVSQCLARLRHGQGIQEHEVLPHQWSYAGVSCSD